MSVQRTPFQKQIAQYGQHGIVSLSFALGFKLKLFDTLAEIATEKSPKTALEVAEKAGLKERYVLEWLSCMACAAIIEVDESGSKFWIPPEHQSDLTSQHPFAMSIFQMFLPMLAKNFDLLELVFRKNGPLGLQYECYTSFYDVMSSFSSVLHGPHLLNGFIPMIDGLKDKLDSGISCLDVGCGNGFHACFLAGHFPKTNFTGIDLTMDAVLAATQRIADEGKGFNNVAFIEMDAKQLNAAWTNKFDWVFIFDACHDQQRPDLCLKEIHRVLKPGGIFSMIEINSSSNVRTDRDNAGIDAAYLYGISMFHCLPVSNNSKDALGMGAMWGQKRCLEILNAAGFKDVKISPTPFSPLNVIYLCKKSA